MNRNRRVFFLLVAASVSGLVLGGVPERMARVALFQVSRVEVEGAHYLTPEEIRGAASVLPAASIWDPTQPVADRVAKHPLVKTVRVRRQIPSTLRIVVEEREPVALVPVPVVSPVDEEGRVLPLDPVALRLDLPILLASGIDPSEEGGERRVTATEIRLLARELVRLEELRGRVSELRSHPEGGVILGLAEPRVDLVYHPPLQLRRLQEGLMVHADVRSRDGRAPSVVDLRFADQVVVRFTQGTGR